MAEQETSGEGEPPVDLDTTPPGGFQPPIASTPQSSKSTGGKGTPKRLRFMDESISKITVYRGPLPKDSNSFMARRKFAHSIPTVPDEARPYNPILYTFRVPDKLAANMSLRVHPPPFYLLLDHTIAVIWCVFNPNAKRQLGIAQMQWALSLLHSLATDKGKKPKDVSLCIVALIDRILELYSEVSVKLEMVHNMEKALNNEKINVVETSAVFSLSYYELEKKYIHMKTDELDGGQLANTDDVFRGEVEKLKDIAGDSFELMDSTSKEAAIDFLEDSKMKHLRNIVKEAERAKSLERLMRFIRDEPPPKYEDTVDFMLSQFREMDSSDLQDTADMERHHALIDAQAKENSNPDAAPATE